MPALVPLIASLIIVGTAFYYEPFVAFFALIWVYLFFRPVINGLFGKLLVALKLREYNPWD